MGEFNVFKNKPILITGHTGFKGAWLSLWLSKLGANVSGFALSEKSPPAAYSALGINGFLQNEMIADIRDRSAFDSFYKKVKPEFTFHLAAQSLVRRSFQEPMETIESNVLGTANVLEVLRRNQGVGLIVTSDKCYENRETSKPYSETDAMGGHDVYSMSKGVCELMTSSYQRSFKLRVATARAGNVIGGGDFSEDRILPDCIRAARAGKPLLMRNPQSVRPWQHVLEPLHGYLTLAEKILSDGGARFCEAFNFGPETTGSVTVKEIVESFFTYYGSGKVELDKSSNQPHEANLLFLNIEKAKSKLGWSPRWSLEKALQTTAQWYREFEAQKLKAGSMVEMSVSQISEYERSKV